MTKLKKIIEDVAANEWARDCNCNSPKDVPKEDTEDESLKQQTQMKAMMENITKSIVKQLQSLIPPKQPILSCEECGGNHHTSYYMKEVAKEAKFMRKHTTKLEKVVINLSTTSYYNLENTMEVIKFIKKIK